MPHKPPVKLHFSQDGTFLMTPQQHLDAADRIRSLAGKPDAPDHKKAEQLARSHELLAAAIADQRPIISEASLAPTMSPTIPTP